MTATEQKKQTRQYFDVHATDWHSKAVGEHDRYNVIAARNGTVLRTIEAMPGVSQFLDVGCGTGQLVLDVANKGIEAKGIDFAPDMIRVCEANRERAGLKAEFDCISFFDLPVQKGHFDVISAQGFIEYISPKETDLFLTRSSSMLRDGGALVVGSRNRLFNVVSLNDYTLAEIKLGTVQQLMEEAIALQQNGSFAHTVEALRKHEAILPQPERHPHTGIEVEVRYQYTPAELIHRARMAGFTPHTLFPVHFHGLPAAIKNEKPDLHVELSNLVDRLAFADFRSIPYCSTFVLDLRKGS